MEEWKNNYNNDDDATLGFWDHIEDILIEQPDVGEEDITRVYFKVCCALRESLKHLYLCHFGIMLDVDSQQSGKILRFLPLFANLTHLSLGCEDGYYDFNTDDPALSIMSIFKACPNLENLLLSSGYPQSLLVMSIWENSNNSYNMSLNTSSQSA